MLWKSVSRLSLLAVVVCSISGEAWTMEGLKEAAEKGDMYAMYKIGRMCLPYPDGQKDSRETLRWYRKAAELGYEDAMYDLGNTDALWQSFLGEALSWCRKAADVGLPGETYSLRCIYRGGQGVLEDKVETALWLQESAEAGVPEAMYDLWYTYEDGEGVQKDPAKGLFWLKKAARAGDEAAKNRLRDIDALWFLTID